VANVLVTDDSPVLRALMVRALTAVGHKVTVAEDGQEAIEILANFAPDLLVLDVEMPRLDGWGVLREMRRLGLFRNTRVLMLTSLSKEKDWLKAYRFGAHQYLTKPFKPEELAETVVTLLEMSGEQAHNHREQELDRALLLARVEAAFTSASSRSH
jgi:DNA-binding response OmpR family regulator